MKQFKFYGYGFGPKSFKTLKSYLNPALQSLPRFFSEKDIKPGMFAPSIEKRLRSRLQHGTKIMIKRSYTRRGSNLTIFVEVIDKDAHKAAMKRKNDKIKSLKKKIKNFDAAELKSLNNTLDELSRLLCKSYKDILGSMK